jgi:hypothetical protein
MDQQTFQWVIASLVMPTVGGVVTYLVQLQRAVTRERVGNNAILMQAKASLETSLNIQRQDQHAFQLKVAQEYATLGTLKDTENRVIAALAEVKADIHAITIKIDSIILRD